MLVVVNSKHHCIARGIRKFSSSSKKDWLDRVVSRHLNVTRATSPQDIVDLLRIRFAEEIDYKQAQMCRMRLLEEDIGAQRHSFQLLPSYIKLLENTAQGVHCDLVRDRHGKSLPPPLLTSTNYLLLQGASSMFSCARLKTRRPSSFYAALSLSTGPF